MSKSEEELIRDVLGELGEEVASNPFVTKACILRYLRAHRLRVDKAVQGIRETLTWREEFGVDRLDAEKLKPVLDDGRMYVSPGRDKQGRVVVMNIKSEQPATDHQLALEMFVYVMEKAIKRMDINYGRKEDEDEEENEEGEKNAQQDHKWIWFLDMTHYSSASSPPLSVTMDTLHILSHHYPERLAVCFIVDAPWVFRFLWNLISPLLDPVTKEKIRFITTEKKAGAENWRLFEDVVERDQLETRFGGTLDFEYEFEREELAREQEQDQEQEQDEEKAQG
jgi:hypothetical protein